MTDESESESNDDEQEVNISKLRQMGLRGKEYRETIDIEYYGLSGDLYVGPVPDTDFLPVAALIEEKVEVDIDPDDFEEQAQSSTEEAKRKLDEARDDGGLDASELDEEFVKVMHEVAALGIDTTQGIAEGEDEEGLKEVLGWLHGGKSLKIAERVMEISSNAQKAEKFRRDGGSE